MSKAIVVLAKSPEPGRVKTRLIPVLGEQQATLVYQRLLQHTLTLASKYACQSSDIEAYLFLSGDAENTAYKKIRFGLTLNVADQAQGDLGSRMSHALGTALEKHDQAVIVGADCPGINSAYLDQAFAQLEHKDLVFGPALDGGYVLLGLKQIHPSMFENMPWSQANLLQQSLARAQLQQLAVATLAPLGDVDYAEDLDLLSLLND